MGARAWPFGGLCPGPERLGLRNSLRSDSPRPISNSGPGRSHAWRRPGVAPWDGALHMQKQKGRAALDAAPTTENTSKALDPGSSPG